MTAHFLTPNPRYQVKYTSIIFLAMLLVALLIGGTTYVSLSSLLTTVESNPELAAKVEGTMWGLMQSYTVRVLLLLAAALIVGFFFSHKIIGPIQRLDQLIKKIGGGDLTTKIVLRSGDEFYKLSETINETVEKFRNILIEDKRLINKARVEAESLAEEVKKGHVSKEVTGVVLEKIQDTLRELEETKKAFRVE